MYYLYISIYLFSITMPEKLKNTGFFSLLCSHRHFPTLWGKNRSQNVPYKTYFRQIEELLLTSVAFESHPGRFYGLPKTTHEVWKQAEGNPVINIPRFHDCHFLSRLWNCVDLSVVGKMRAEGRALPLPGLKAVWMAWQCDRVV